MKRTICVLVLTTLMLSSIAQAQPRGLGIGIIAGEPTGLSLKVGAGANTAFDAALGWSFGRYGDGRKVGNSRLYFHGDYLYYNATLFREARGRLPFYYGIGFRIITQDEFRFGVRIPLGVEFLPREAPLGLFFEIVPLLDLVPATDFTIQGAVGVRFYLR